MTCRPCRPCTFMLPSARNISADHPVVHDSVLPPFSFSPFPSTQETGSCSVCLDGCALRGTSRQRNTHSLESREVRYPWHPWHARAVAVHEAFTWNGRAVFRCGVDEKPGARLLEIPQWMFDSVACCRMRPATVPMVSCGALLDLKALANSLGRNKIDKLCGVRRKKHDVAEIWKQQRKCGNRRIDRNSFGIWSGRRDDGNRTRI
jgi:hypothetical protein